MIPKWGSALYFYRIDAYGEHPDVYVYLVATSVTPGIISLVNGCIIRDLELAVASVSKRRLSGIVLEESEIATFVALMGKRLYNDSRAFSFLIVEDV